MSPRSFATRRSESVDAGVSRLFVLAGVAIREARRARRWSVRELASRAGISRVLAYRIEAGRPVSLEGIVRATGALGLRADIQLLDPRRRADSRAALSVDAVHSAMGELEAAQLRGRAFSVGMDEPYQHFQFAGRADLVAWDLSCGALLHVENRTRFPDFQEMAGAYNAKRAYLAAALGERVGVSRWASQTHVIAALWSSEVLHALRLRTASFRALCPDDPGAFAAWWGGDPPAGGRTSSLVVLDPLATGRQRTWVSLDDALAVRPRHRGYAEAAARLLGETA